jgi:hypothetical protein
MEREIFEDAPMKTWFLYLAVFLVVGASFLIADANGLGADACRWIIFPGYVLDQYFDRRVVNLGRADGAAILITSWLIWSVVAHFVLLIVRSFRPKKS